MNKEYIIKAYAKINLSLDVLSKRPDGYHELKMIMHTVKGLYDLITVKETNDKVKILSNNSFVPDNNNNIVYKAHKAFYEYTNIKEIPFIYSIDKNIPVCAGLGGGSSDAAAVLKFLNTYHNNFLTLNELIKLGKSVGADVPFCIKEGTCLAEGIGEILTELPPLPKCFIVIAKPKDIGLSTPHIFSKVDASDNFLHPSTEEIITALKSQDLNGVCKRLFNVLETYSIDECPDIQKYKSIFIENNALGTLMSGSGNSVFAIFNNKDYAENSVNDLKRHTNKVFLTINE